MGRKRAPPRWEGGSVPTAKRSSTRLRRQGAAGPGMAAVTSCADLLARRPGNDSVHTDPSVQEQGTRAGQVVWARLGSARWWPAVRISGPECGQSPARLGHTWVFWLGDHKVSQVPEAKVVDFADEYRERRSSLGGKLYKAGLLEALQDVAARSPGLPQGADSSHLIAWAEAGFLSGSGAPQIAPAVSVSKRVGVHLERLRQQREEARRVQRTVPPVEVGSGHGEGEASSRCDWAAGIGDSLPLTPPGGALEDLRRGRGRIEEVCVACGSVPGVAASEHPLVEGAMCADCRGCFLETFFSCQDDGTFDHCVICGRTGHLVVCDVSSCNRCFCVGCIQRLVHQKELEKVLAASPWRCYLCSGRAVGLLRCRPDWQQRLLELFRPPGPRCPPPPVPLEEERRPIRVLSLFDGIGTGRYVLDQIGIAVEAYFASEVDQGAINVGITQHGTGISYLGPVESVTDAQIQALCPVDLLLAGSPCNDLSLVNPARKGLYDCSGSGALFFDFHRLLRAVQLANRGHHLFWVYENVAAMPRDCKRTISRFLECEPTLLDARFFSAQVRARYFWGNVPGMYSTLSTPVGDAFRAPHVRCLRVPPVPRALPPRILERSVDLSSVLDPLLNRKALVEKIRTVTTRSNSLRQGKQGLLPVQVGERGADVLWITELERVFGFPSHYTDVGNLSLGRRQQLLGRAWSVPVVCHLLGPLRDFFRAGERRPPTREC